MFEIMEIYSNICSLPDAPKSRPFSVSGLVILIILIRKKIRSKVSKIKEETRSVIDILSEESEAPSNV